MEKRVGFDASKEVTSTSGSNGVPTQNRLCLSIIDERVRFGLLARQKNGVDVVESNLVDIDEFAGVWSIGFDSQFPRNVVGDFDVKQLRIGLDIKGNSTLLVS